MFEVLDSLLFDTTRDLGVSRYDNYSIVDELPLFMGGTTNR